MVSKFSLRRTAGGVMQNRDHAIEGFIPIKPDTARSHLSAWRRRLSATAQVSRTRNLIQQEYDRDKYRHVAESNSASVAAAAEALAARAGIDLDAARTVSIGDDLYQASFRRAFNYHDSILDGAVNRYRGRHVCELGCGFGVNVSRFGPRAYGGELTKTGVTIAQSFGLDVQEFDFVDPSAYELIRPETTVVTCAAIEQLRSAEPILTALRQRQERIDVVIHFEPTFRHSRASELGALKNEYTIKNDYNRDLEELLLAASDIEVLEVAVEAIGIVPLNPSHLFVWRFRR